MAALQGDGMEPNAGLLRECRAIYDGWARFGSAHGGLGIMFLWAVAEATVWPIIPDFLLVPMAAGARRRFYLPLAAAIAGMAVGGSAIFLFAFVAPHQASSFLSHLPLVHDSQIRGAHRRLARDGVAAFFFQPWSGISFKVWAVVGGAMHANPWLAIPTFIVARSLRMAAFATGTGLLADRFAGFVRDFSLFLAVIYLALFFYGWWQVMTLS